MRHLRHRRRSASALAVALLLGLAFTVFRPPSTPGPLERDFEAYYAAGATALSGGDPYGRDVWDAERRVPGVDTRHAELLPFVGPAAFLPFWSLLARLPYSVALVVWSALLLAAMLTIVGVALRLARVPRDPWRYGLAIATAIASAPAIGALALGQAALVAAGGVAAAIAAYGARWAAAAAGATLLAALQPNLALVLAARLRSRWDVAIAGGAAAAFACLGLAAGGGAAGFAAYLHRLGAHAAAERFVIIQHTPASVAYSLGVPAMAAAAIGAAVAFTAVAAAVLAIVRERLDATTATLVACALLPLAMPFFHEPDFVLELLPVLVLSLRAQGRARELAAVATVFVLVDWFGLAQRHAPGQILCLGFAVAFGFIGLRPPAAAISRFGRADLTGLLALALLAVAATGPAAAHPAPTWPDRLPAHYAAPPAADASGVWGDEQRAAGLRARDPVWGLLRAIPLAGCALLAAALIADRRRERRAQPRAGYRREAGVLTVPAPLPAALRLRRRDEPA
jgi:hypothetical protein